MLLWLPFFLSNWMSYYHDNDHWFYQPEIVLSASKKLIQLSMNKYDKSLIMAHVSLFFHQGRAPVSHTMTGRYFMNNQCNSVLVHSPQNNIVTVHFFSCFLHKPNQPALRLIKLHILIQSEIIMIEFREDLFASWSTAMM